MAEKGVVIAKNIVKRCYEEGGISGLEYRILEYNATPVASMGMSPPANQDQVANNGGSS